MIAMEKTIQAFETGLRTMPVALAMVGLMGPVEWLLLGSWTLVEPILWILVAYFTFALGLVSILFALEAVLLYYGENDG